jgi:hypothetical protein
VPELLRLALLAAIAYNAWCHEDGESRAERHFPTRLANDRYVLRATEASSH